MAEPVGKMFVVADVQRDIVIIDGIMDEPIPAGVAVTEIGFSHELSVGDIDETIWDRYADLHVLNFVAPLIFVRPPDTRSYSFARSVDPGMSGRIFAESETAESAGLDG